MNASSLLSLINKEAERLNWPELNEEAAKAAKELEESTADTAGDPLTYLMRLAHRTKAWKKPCEFGQIRLRHDFDCDYIMFYNYSYEQYKWARANKLTERLDNIYFLVPFNRFQDGVLQELKERAVNNYDKSTGGS